MEKFGLAERIRLFHRVAWIAFSALVGVWVLSLLNINPRNPRFDQKPYYAKYKVEGVLAKKLGTELTFRSFGNNQFRLESKNLTKTFEQTQFSPFWFFIKNPVVYLFLRSLVTRDINKITVYDAVGILGEPKETYKLKLHHRMILWSRILDSQASYKIGLYDKNGKEIATGIYDATCGLLFNLDIHRDGLSSLKLVKTSFPISRNRYWEIAIAILWGLGVIFYQRFWRSRKRLADKPKLAKIEFDLVWIGALCIWIDCFYDIWFFHYLWNWGLIGIHLVMLVIFWWKYKGWAVFPFLEIFWSFLFTGGNDRLIPQFSFFPALLMTWMAILLFKSFRSQLKAE